VLLVSLFFFSSVSLIINLHSSTSGISAAELKEPGPLVIVPAMTPRMAMLIAMYGVVKRRYQRPFW
jgi:hypothetical protein